MNGMHIIYVPPSVLKNFPAMWLQMVTKHRGELQFISMHYCYVFTMNFVEKLYSHDKDKKMQKPCKINEIIMCAVSKEVVALWYDTTTAKLMVGSSCKGTLQQYNITSVP